MSLTANFLIAAGVGHCGVGLLDPHLRDPFLRALAEGSILSSSDKNEQYARECAFWFQFGGAMVILSGVQALMYSRRFPKHEEQPSWYGWSWIGLGLGGLGLARNPGFLLSIAQGARIVWINQSQASNKKKNPDDHDVSKQH